MSDEVYGSERKKMNIVKIRKYEDCDAEFVYQAKRILYKKYVEECWGTWKEDEQEKRFQDFISKVKNDTWIIQLDSRDIGFYNGCNLEDGSYEIGNICILPEYQGKGIGTQVLKDILQEHKQQDVHIQCFKKNPVAKLYERLGFVLEGESEFHYKLIKRKDECRKSKLRNSFLAIILIMCTLVTPFTSYAEQKSDISDSIYEYRKEEQKTLDNIPEIGCKAAYVANPETGKVIYEKNAHEAMYPASTTKILTALVVLENCELTDKAVVSKHALELVPSDYTNAKLKVGEEHDIKTLLYALMLPSANEAANVLAEHVSGSVEAFVELCNKRAKELGCENLHFVNTNGMHDKNHYCTAYDLYLIAKECQKYEAFNEIVKTKSFTVPATNIYPKNDRKFENTNELLLPGKYYYSYCTGIKTGHTNDAGECLVASSSKDNLNLISVVLGGKKKNSKGLNERFYDTKQLLDFVYANYSTKEIVEKGHSVATIDVDKGTKETASLDLVVDTSISTIVPNDIDKNNISSSVSINENIVAPISQNQVLGQITYYADGLEYKVNLVASHQVDKIPYEKYNLIAACAISIVIIVITKLFMRGKKKK